MPSLNTLWRYKLTEDEYERILSAQGGVCAVCRTPSKKLVIDHDHSCCAPTRRGMGTCGRCTRGLVCYRCNNFLGFIEGLDRPALARALQYLDGRNAGHVESSLPSSQFVLEADANALGLTWRDYCRQFGLTFEPFDENEHDEMAIAA